MKPACFLIAASLTTAVILIPFHAYGDDIIYSYCSLQEPVEEVAGNSLLLLSYNLSTAEETLYAGSRINGFRELASRKAGIDSGLTVDGDFATLQQALELQRMVARAPFHWIQTRPDPDNLLVDSPVQCSIENTP